MDFSKMMDENHDKSLLKFKLWKKILFDIFYSSIGYCSGVITILHISLNVRTYIWVLQHTECLNKCLDSVRKEDTLGKFSRVLRAEFFACVRPNFRCGCIEIFRICWNFRMFFSIYKNKCTICSVKWTSLLKKC